jgi:hypothetical protein
LNWYISSFPVYVGEPPFGSFCGTTNGVFEMDSYRENRSGNSGPAVATGSDFTKDDSAGAWGSAMLSDMADNGRANADEQRLRGAGPAGRLFGWQDMFVDPAGDPRGIGGIFVHHSDERTVLAGYLHDYRLTLQLKCAGLDAEEVSTLKKWRGARSSLRTCHCSGSFGTCRTPSATGSGR